MAADDGDVDAGVSLARRKFLKVAVYTAPAVTTTVSVNKALAQKVSCGPASCSPRAPGSTCGPATCPPMLGCLPVLGCPPMP